MAMPAATSLIAEGVLAEWFQCLPVRSGLPGAVVHVGGWALRRLSAVQVVGKA